MHNENENQDRPEKEAPKSANALTRLYDKLPFTFRQVDIFVKILLALIAALLVYGILKGRA